MRLQSILDKSSNLPSFVQYLVYEVQHASLQSEQAEQKEKEYKFHEIGLVK